MSINRVVISGNLSHDPELRRTQSGMAILSFGMAVNDRRRNSQTDEWEDYANWIDVTMFGNYAESLSNILVKGMKVTVEDRLRWSSWEKDGQKRSKVEVIGEQIELPPRQQSGQGGYNGQSQQQANNYTPSQQNGGYSQSQPQQNGNYGNQYQPPQQQSGYNSSVYDDDIPF